MLAGYSPIVQALMGTFFTWFLTALGAGLVFIFKSGQRKILDASLGFAAGVMTAASYWSLLAPGIEMAKRSGLYGSEGQWAFVPVAIGFLLGSAFVYCADVFMPQLGSFPTSIALAMEGDAKYEGNEGDEVHLQLSEQGEISDLNHFRNTGQTSTKRRNLPIQNSSSWSQNKSINSENPPNCIAASKLASWKRIRLLIMAITIHNIPEGLAVGVGFGAIGKSPSATLENARNLAIGIGIQNFPEGLAVSLPLRGAGLSTFKSFWYGQLSGMVEPIAGLFGALAVVVAEPLLPYALAFAAGAMIYVVVDDIIPEAQMCGNGKLASWGAIVGFVIMMSLDVGLG